MSEVHEFSWSETILRLAPGEHAPIGFEIKRVIGTYQRPTGSGTNYEDVFVVACRHALTTEAALQRANQCVCGSESCDECSPGAADVAEAGPLSTDIKSRLNVPSLSDDIRESAERIIRDEGTWTHGDAQAVAKVLLNLDLRGRVAEAHELLQAGDDDALVAWLAEQAIDNDPASATEPALKRANQDPDFPAAQVREQPQKEGST